MSNLVVVDHPLIAHKLSLMRDKATPSAQFRTLLREISLLLGYEVLRDLPTELRDIETPVGPARTPFLKGKKLVFVPILRAGSGLVDGLLELVPSASVGHIGLYRDPKTLEAIEYYCKVPEDIAAAPDHRRRSHAGDRPFGRGRHQRGCRRAAHATSASSACWRHRRGVAEVARAHPDVRVFTAALDDAPQ